VVEALQDAGAQVAQTPACGAMRWDSAHGEEMHCERQARRRYWHHPLGHQAVAEATR